MADVFDEIMQGQSAETLARWWALLNCFEVPKDLADLVPEIKGQKVDPESLCLWAGAMMMERIESFIGVEQRKIGWLKYLEDKSKRAINKDRKETEDE